MIEWIRKTLQFCHLEEGLLINKDVDGKGKLHNLENYLKKI